MTVTLARLYPSFLQQAFAMKERSNLLIMTRSPWKTVFEWICWWVIVRIFGTEDRKCEVFIGMINEIRPLISFNRSGISSIRIISNVVYGMGGVSIVFILWPEYCERRRGFGGIFELFRSPLGRTTDSPSTEKRSPDLICCFMNSSNMDLEIPKEMMLPK